mgnify:CR=1 FL=1
MVAQNVLRTYDLKFGNFRTLGLLYGKEQHWGKKPEQKYEREIACHSYKFPES